MLHEAKWILAVLLLAVSLAGAQEVNGPGELSSLEEIDRQLNNPLSKTWALVLQDNIGIQEGDLIDGSTWNIRLQITPVIKSPFIK